MKKISFLASVVAVLTTGTFLSGCSRDEILGTETQQNGPEFIIQTSDVAFLPDPAATRTMFQDGEVNGEVGPGLSKNILWKVGDELSTVHVYLDNDKKLTEDKLTASNYHPFVLAVNELTDNGVRALFKANSAVGLNQNEKPATAKYIAFVGSYPKTGGLSATTGITGVSPAWKPVTVIKPEGTQGTANVGFDENRVVKLTYNTPLNQVCTLGSTENPDVYTSPDMKNYYMAGYMLPTEGDIWTLSKMTLNYAPALSTLMVKLTNPTSSAIKVKGIKIEHVNAADGSTVGYAKKYISYFQNVSVTKTVNGSTTTENHFNCTALDDTQTGTSYVTNAANAIQVTLAAPSDNSDLVDANGEYTIPAGGSVMVTAFLPPYDYSYSATASVRHGLKISVLSSDSKVANRFARIGFVETSKFQPGSKKAITLPISANVQPSDPIDTEKWMSKLPDETRLFNISIPGAHNALNVHPNNNASIVAFNQYATVTSMLNNGVRALDLRLTDATGSSAGNFSGYTQGISSGEAYYKNVNNAVQLVKNWIKNHGTETVIVLVTAQRYAGGTTANNDNDMNIERETAVTRVLAGRWNGDFQSYIGGGGSLQDRQPDGVSVLKNFERDLTLGECRGKVLLINRPLNLNGTTSDATKFYNYSDRITSQAYLSTWADVRYDYTNGTQLRETPTKPAVGDDPRGNDFTTAAYSTTNGASQPAFVKNGSINASPSLSSGENMKFYYLDADVLGWRDWKATLDNVVYHKNGNGTHAGDEVATSLYTLKGKMVVDYLKFFTKQSYSWGFCYVPAFVLDLPYYTAGAGIAANPDLNANPQGSQYATAQGRGDGYFKSFYYVGGDRLNNNWQLGNRVYNNIVLDYLNQNKVVKTGVLFVDYVPGTRGTYPNNYYQEADRIDMTDAQVSTSTNLVNAIIRTNFNR